MNDPTFTFGNIGLPLVILAAVAGVLPWAMVPRETRSQRRVTGIVVMVAVFMLILSAAVMSIFDKRVVEAGSGLPEQGAVAWLYIKSALPAVMAWGPVLLLVWLGLAQRVERLKGEDMARGDG